MDRRWAIASETFMARKVISGMLLPWCRRRNLAAIARLMMVLPPRRSTPSREEAPMKARLAVGIVTGMAAILITVATSRADPNLKNVPAHRHFVSTAAGLIQVGPNLCDNPELQRA